MLALAPVHAQALNALGFFLAERGERLEEAQRLVERALELAPGTPAFLDSLGWVAFQRGAYEAALPPLREAFERRGDGEIAAHLGRPTGALAVAIELARRGLGVWKRTRRIPCWWKRYGAYWVIGP